MCIFKILIFCLIATPLGPSFISYIFPHALIFSLWFTGASKNYDEIDNALYNFEIVLRRQGSKILKFEETRSDIFCLLLNLLKKNTIEPPVCLSPMEFHRRTTSIQTVAQQMMGEN